MNAIWLYDDLRVHPSNDNMIFLNKYSILIGLDKMGLA